MKKLTRIFFVLSISVFFVHSVLAEEARFGYVNAAKLLEEAPQAEAATDLLKEEFSSREDQMVAAQKSLKEQEDKLAKQGDFMSLDERKKLEMDILSQKRDLRRQQDEYREDLNIRRNDEINKLQQYIKQAVEEVGRAGNYDLIFYEGVAFANPRIDVTDQVLMRLKEQTKKAPESPAK